MYENVSFSSLTNIICKANELLPLLMDRKKHLIYRLCNFSQSEKTQLTKETGIPTKWTRTHKETIKILN